MEAGQKEHTQSKLIQDLNKEIEYHDKVIEILRGMVSDRTALDECVIKALQGEIKLQRPFYLREELLDKIKGEKKRYVSFKDKFTREAEAAKNRKFESRAIDATGAVLDTLDLDKSLGDLANLAKKMGTKNSEMETVIARLQAEVDKNTIEMDSLRSKLSALTDQTQGVDGLQQNYSLLTAEFKALTTQLVDIKGENARLQAVWDTSSSNQSAESAALVAKIATLEQELYALLSANSAKEETLVKKGETLEIQQGHKASQKQYGEELVRLEEWNKKKLAMLVAQRDTALEAEQRVAAERERLEAAQKQLGNVRQEVEAQGRRL